MAGEEGTTENGKDQSKRGKMVINTFVKPEDRREKWESTSITGLNG